MGTPDYMAPEQVRGKRGDRRTDIYSLGAILYEMVTGCAPFEGATPLVIMNARLTGDPAAPRAKNPDIPPTVEEIILHAMARDISQRYSHVAEMKAELDHLETVQITGRAQRLVTPTAWTNRWQHWWIWVLGGAIPVIVVLVIWLLSHLQWK